MRRLLMALMCAVIVGTIPGAAWATPVSGVTGKVLGKGTSIGTIEVKNRGLTDVIVRHIIIEPGGSLGWHSHPGELITVVHKGTLSRTLQDCTVVTTPAGQSFVEPAGKRHLGRNQGIVPLELYVTYVIPAGAPVSVDTADPGC
ncbi:MAG: cupin domain-containing protein [Pseudonocardiaceae bacterium]